MKSIGFKELIAAFLIGAFGAVITAGLYTYQYMLFAKCAFFCDMPIVGLLVIASFINFVKGR